MTGVIVRAAAHRAVDRHFTAAILDPVESVGSAEITPAVVGAIVDWYGTNRRDLAFRRTSDPYAILVSEVIAQQTQAERAAARWERFMARFPTVDALAAASPADVLREWQGLGYDRRALNLWRAARVIRDEQGGRVPRAVDDLDALPGIGAYTARAIAAIAFGEPVGAVDVNVRRVLGRIVRGADGVASRDVQAEADRAAALTDPATWTHAVMDLGATVCRPRNPTCERCPVRASCRYAVSVPAGRQATVAQRRPSAAFPSTNRWLRGRILDRLRAAPDGSWVAFDGPIGSHGTARVQEAARALAADGLVELHEPSPTDVEARLAVA
jgi:A/G-specific adenine glycosylase